MERPSVLQGQLERITFKSEETGYTVARLKVKGQKDLATIVGNLVSVNVGEELKLTGKWTSHKKYGEQFSVEQYETIVPATVVGIEKYLGSGLIKGIGPKMAKRIVDEFGPDTLDIIEHSMEKLSSIEGIGAGRVQMIKDAWEEQKEIKEVMVFLQGHGVSTTFAAKIFKKYGKASISIVKDNPYRLAHDIYGIGFDSADKIAFTLGIEKDSEKRAEAGILYVLDQLSGDGHVYYPYELLIEKCMQTLSVLREVIVKALGGLSVSEKIIIEDINEGEVVQNNKAVYLARFHVSETGAATHLKRLLRTGVRGLDGQDIEKALGWAQKDLSITLAEKQKHAVQAALKHKVMVITGGPGTGKTTIINSIIRIFKRMQRQVLLAAPTGRAAKKMSEATGHEAKTIHRMLEVSPREGGFKRNEKNPLEADLLVVDEVSMVDTVLMYHLLKAVPSHATLILVGDLDQLPSVGAGSVLKDIIGSGQVPTVTLDEIFRQSRQSRIVLNAHRVNKGQMPDPSFERDTPQDFYYIELDEPEAILQKVIELCRERIPQKFELDPLRDIQVITAMHKGLLGTRNLNLELQKTLNPAKSGLARGDRTFKPGDKVMQTSNNYDRDVFNGDIGVIKKINSEAQEIVVDFDGRLIPYDYRDLEELLHAYAISVHKSQGSEYPAVVMPIHTQHYVLLQRNLLYTGITRGKRLVVLVGSKRAVTLAVGNNEPGQRYCLLRDRLKGILKGS